MKKVYILHGWTYSTDKWQEAITLLKNNKELKPILLKIPGLTEQTDKAWTLADYVDWLKKVVGSEKTILVGHSNGGRIALAFAAKYPDNLKQLILIDSAGIYHNELPLRLKRLIFGTAAKVGKKITSSKSLRALLYKAAGEKDYHNASLPMRQTMANLISFDLTSQLTKVKVPTLIIWGEQDNITPLADGKFLHKHINNSKLVVINQAGHAPQFTYPKKVCQEILSEIEKL